MRDELEKRLQNFFPPSWKGTNIAEFWGSPRFDRDEAALDKALNQPIRELLFRGGKRMRPLLFLTLLKGFGKDPMQYLDFACLIELVHNGTLAIDDIEDNSDVRRGKPTLHKIFGIDVAVNAGVAMHILLLQTLAMKHSSITEKMRIRLYEIYSEEVNNVYAGQSLDIYWHKHAPDTITHEQYLEMARLKTGGLARMAVRFASVLAEQGQDVERTLVNFAESAGIAFQIRDDVLDITADREEFGKSFGNDIAEGKISLPVVLALQQLGDKEKQRLRAILLKHSKDQDILTEAQSLITKTNAITQSMQQAEQLINEAWGVVESAVPAGEGRDMLEELARSFITRKK